MYNLMKCEIMKLKRSLPLKILAALMLIFSAVTSLSSLSYVGSPYQRELEIALSGYDAFFSSLRDMPTIVMIGTIIIAFVVCADFENRAIQSEIAAGHSRLSVLLSKLFAFSLAYLVAYLPYPVGRAVLQGVLIEFGAPLSAGVLLRMLTAFLTVLLSAIAANGAVFLLAFALRRSILVTGIGFVAVVLGGTAFMSFTYSLPALSALADHVPAGFFRALAAHGYRPETLLRVAALGLLYIGAAAGITYGLFRRAELK